MNLAITVASLSAPTRIVRLNNYGISLAILLPLFTKPMVNNIHIELLWLLDELRIESEQIECISYTFASRSSKSESSHRCSQITVAIH